VKLQISSTGLTGKHPSFTGINQPPRLVATVRRKWNLRLNTAV